MHAFKNVLSRFACDKGVCAAVAFLFFFFKLKKERSTVPSEPSSWQRAGHLYFLSVALKGLNKYKNS